MQHNGKSVFIKFNRSEGLNNAPYIYDDNTLSWYLCTDEYNHS